VGCPDLTIWHSSCWSLYLFREEFLSAPIHSPLSVSSFRSFTLHHRENSIWDATQIVCPLIDIIYSCFANLHLSVHHYRDNHMTFVKALLEVLQIASWYESIFLCKSEIHLILYSVNSLYSSSSSILCHSEIPWCHTQLWLSSPIIIPQASTFVTICFAQHRKANQVLYNHALIFAFVYLRITYCMSYVKFNG
jgi:hypothetical protein